MYKPGLVFPLCDFYPRSPCGERRDRAGRESSCNDNFYPRSPCGERPGHRVVVAILALISIHALLAESDKMLKDFSTSALVFLSTLSLRRATLPCPELVGRGKFLSTLSLRRATIPNAYDSGYHFISIHALLAESDSKSAQNSGALLRI